RGATTAIWIEGRTHPAVFPCRPTACFIPAQWRSPGFTSRKSMQAESLPHGPGTKKEHPVPWMLLKCLVIRAASGQQRILGRGWGLFFRSRLVLDDFDEWLESHLAVMIEAGARGDDVTHDHVLLEPAQVIDAGARGSFGQDTRGVLEGSRAEEALGFE